LPSPVRSAAATASGLSPTAKFSGGPNVPSPLPGSTLTLLLLPLTTMMSGMPSPVTSATIVSCGPLPAGKVFSGPNVPLPLPSSTLTVLSR
jgi:hypothetical protein